MFLPENARKLLITARAQPMACKTPNFPDMVLTDSSCGTFKFCKTDKFLLIVFPESEPGKGDGLVLYAFFKRDWSNFSGVKALDLTCDDKIRQALLNVRFDCGEQVFKALCAILFIDPETGKNMKVLEAVLNAPEPKKAKSATNDIEGFDRNKWDDKSIGAMIDAQFYKLRDSTYRDRFIEVARIAKEHKVKASRVYFMEATEPTPATEDKPEYPADRVWGSGVGVDRLQEEIVAKGLTEEFRAYLANPIANKKLASPLVIDGEKLGSNKLGEAMRTAFELLVGADYKFLDESMEAFLTRGTRENFFDYVAYDDAALQSPTKRSRSEEFIDLTGQDEVAMESQPVNSPRAVEESQPAVEESQAVNPAEEDGPEQLRRTLSF